jgi:hypothetical protein
MKEFINIRTENNILQHSRMFYVRKSRLYARTSIFLIILLFGVSICFIRRSGEIQSPKFAIKYVYSDSINTFDLKVMNTLIPILKAREGLKLSPYESGGYYYIGYGHQIGKYCPNWTITENQADSILISDIRKAYFERQRILRPELLGDLYSIFTSGTKNGNRKSIKR